MISISTISNRGRLDYVWWLSFVTLIGIFVVNFMGFVDTETGSALGCGHQWPLCNHQLLPTTWNEHVLYEYVHRALVATVAILMLVMSILAWRKYGEWLEVRILIWMAGGFVIVESIVGAVAVLLPSVSPAVLAVTLGISLLSFSGSVLLTVVLAQIQWKTKGVKGANTSHVVKLRDGGLPKTFKVWAVIAVAYTFLAMYVGAYVAKSGAGNSFRGFPFPTETYQHAGTSFDLDVLHRSLALGLFAFILGLLIATYRWRKYRPDLYKGSIIAMFLVVCQAVTGALLIYTHLSIAAFMLHTSVVSCLFASLCYLGLQTLPEPERTSNPMRKVVHSDAMTQ